MYDHVHTHSQNRIPFDRNPLKVKKAAINNNYILYKSYLFFIIIFIAYNLFFKP